MSLSHQSRLKGEACKVRFHLRFLLSSLPAALEQFAADRPIPVLHQEQARKQTNMDAVRYSTTAAADNDDAAAACTEIMLPRIVVSQFNPSFRHLMTGCDLYRSEI